MHGKNSVCIFYVLKVGHGFICIKVRIISINIIVNVKIFFLSHNHSDSYLIDDKGTV